MSVKTYVGYYGPSRYGNSNVFSHASSIDEAERKLQSLSDHTKVTRVVVNQEIGIPRWIKIKKGYEQVYCFSTVQFSGQEVPVSTLREVLKCARKYSHSPTLTEVAWERIRSNRWDRNTFESSEFTSIYMTT